ncbi:MAG: phosphatidylglycerol lysyltransferase domain-containing protein [Streptococcus salivarius]
MKAVSDIWLNGRKEKGFSLGFFDVAYLQQAPIAIVRVRRRRNCSLCQYHANQKQTGGDD